MEICRDLCFYGRLPSCSVGLTAVTFAASETGVGTANPTADRRPIERPRTPVLVLSERGQRRRARSLRGKCERHRRLARPSLLEAIVPRARWALAKPPGCPALRHPSPR